MLAKNESKRRRGQQRVRWLDSITNSMGMTLSKLQEIVKTGKPGVLLSMGLQRVRHEWATEYNKKTQYLISVVWLILSCLHHNHKLMSFHRDSLFYVLLTHSCGVNCDFTQCQLISFNIFLHLQLNKFPDRGWESHKDYSDLIPIDKL